LVNNAAITGEEYTSLAKGMAAAFVTNATGPALIVQAFESLLKESSATPRIINVTSGAGSIASRLDYTNPHQKMKAVSPFLASCTSLLLT
jgi:NAD(P)-dependent dehydrogenase (short-subunit alcohol dehydrogenase family)